ncbi:tetratricopeptide repeat protein [Sneathiella aquimaris]|uniref:tetratricopeptide repeat protein n=1 Tax=Sneathiella aquimaris TaxID=2599305 RepID=UPI00146E001D|nr:tetratricopeptide repeat protein [Sneathiella aquimaris]
MRVLLLIVSFSILLGGCSGLGATSSSLKSNHQEDKLQGVKVANALRQNGDKYTSLLLYQKLLEKDPDNADALQSSAELLYELGSYNEALSTYEKLLSQKKGDCVVYLGLARLYLRQVRPASAVIVLQKCLGLEAESRNAMKLLAISFDLMGQYDRSKPLYERSLKANPTDVALQNNYALSLLQSGDFQPAIDILSALAFGVNSNVRIRQNLTIAYVLSGDQEAAVHVASLDYSPDEIKPMISYYQLASLHKNASTLRALFAYGKSST